MPMKIPVIQYIPLICLTSEGVFKYKSPRLQTICPGAHLKCHKWFTHFYWLAQMVYTFLLVGTIILALKPSNFAPC